MGNIFTSIIENCSCGTAANSNDEIQHIKDAIHTIKNNHLAHIQNDMLEMRMDIKIIKEAILNIKIDLKK